MALRDEFSEDELSAIRAATRAVEADSGGELVCVLVERCDVYESAIWKAALGGAVGGALIAGLWHSVAETWAATSPSWIVLPPLLGAAIALLVVGVLPAARRLLIPAPILERRVDRRAAQAFLDEEIFDTRDRTGVLLFVTLFERRIRILCDRGIEERIPAEAWNGIARDLARRLRRGGRSAALVEAITACGRLLAERGVARRPDDLDELDNRPRLYDE